MVEVWSVFCRFLLVSIAKNKFLSLDNLNIKLYTIIQCSTDIELIFHGFFLIACCCLVAMASRKNETACDYALLEGLLFAVHYWNLKSRRHWLWRYHLLLLFITPNQSCRRANSFAYIFINLGFKLQQRPGMGPGRNMRGDSVQHCYRWSPH